MSNEVRVVDPKTGGEKGSKLQRFSLIPWEFLFELASHYGRGARKYADRNWEKGYKWSLSEDAAFRHYAAFRLGEEFDAETGTHHLICAVWHLIALYIFRVRGLGTDDITPEGIRTLANLGQAGDPGQRNTLAQAKALGLIGEPLELDKPYAIMRGLQRQPEDDLGPTVKRLLGG